MTELQIKAAAQKEEERHNRESEKLTHAQNEVAKQHYQTSDAYMATHYQASDTAGLVSANAAAMNAGTNRSKYEMEYDIEYGWTGDKGYPEGMPLSAQRKNAELAYLIEYTAPQTRAQTEQIEAQTEKVYSDIDVNKSNIKKNEATVLNYAANAGISALNAVFGKGGIIQHIDK